MLPSSKSTKEIRLKGFKVESHITSSIGSTDSTQLTEIEGDKQFFTQLTEVKGIIPSRSSMDKASSAGSSTFLIFQTHLDLGKVDNYFFKKGK